MNNTYGMNATLQQKRKEIKKKIRRGDYLGFSSFLSNDSRGREASAAGASLEDSAGAVCVWGVETGTETGQGLARTLGSGGKSVTKKKKKRLHR